MVNNELTHHGIKGQKWGVRRFQNKNGSLTAEGKKRYSENSGNNKQTIKDADSFVKSKSSIPVSKLTGGAGEDLAIQVAAYAVAAAVMVAYAKISEKLFRKKKDEEFEELYRNRELKSFKDVPKLSKKMSPTESVKVTNPDYPDMGSTMNCTFCTTAMALREKGYDVKAAKSAEGWYADTLFSKTFNSPEVKMKKARTTEDVIKELSSQGDGAYGNLGVNWKYGGGHSIFWKNENGTTNFYDGQSGTEYTKYSDKKSLLDSATIRATTYNRLDNCEPTDYALGIVESVKKK